MTGASPDFIEGLPGADLVAKGVADLGEGHEDSDPCVAFVHRRHRAAPGIRGRLRNWLGRGVIGHA